MASEMHKPPECGAAECRWPNCNCVTVSERKDAEIERLSAERDEAIAKHKRSSHEAVQKLERLGRAARNFEYKCGDLFERAEEAEAENATLRAQLDEARRVIKPFAEDETMCCRESDHEAARSFLDKTPEARPDSGGETLVDQVSDEVFNADCSNENPTVRDGGLIAELYGQRVFAAPNPDREAEPVAWALVNQHGDVIECFQTKAEAENFEGGPWEGDQVKPLAFATPPASTPAVTDDRIAKIENINFDVTIREALTAALARKEAGNG